MFGRRVLLRAVLFIGLVPALSVGSEAHASQCKPRYPTAETTALMFDVAQSLQQSLDEMPQSTNAVLLARGGQDLRRYGLTYSHAALAVRDEHRQWQVVHLLNRCKTGESDLYQEGLVNFVGESVLRADILVVVPAPDLQSRLKSWLTNAASPARTLHEPKYNMVAYPFSVEYQNSNQWVLEVLAAAAMKEEMGAPDRKQVQAWLRAKGYRPSRLHIKLHERIGARFGLANVTTVDHPAGERLSGDYSVVTVDSVVEFLEANHWLAKKLVVSRDTVESGPGGVLDHRRE